MQKTSKVTSFCYNRGMDERYLTFTTYCKNTFRRKLYRVSLDGGFNCPNRDGTVSTGGCIFCAGGSGDFAIHYDGQKLTKEDFIFNHQDARLGDYIGYFQAYSNTYGPIEKLKRLYTSALNEEWFAGISIATRPDCFTEEIYFLLKELKKSYPDKFIWIELGLQSANDNMAKWMNRGYLLDVFDRCVQRLHALDIPVITHIILGLPENKEDVLDTIHHLNALHIDGIKIHLLHILKGTTLGKAYIKEDNGFSALTKEEYVDLVCTCIANLNPNIVVHRLTGDGNKEELIAPIWSLDKKNVLNTIRHELKERKIVQGCAL